MQDTCIHIILVINFMPAFIKPLTPWMMPVEISFQSLRDDRLHIELCSVILVSVTMADCHGH